MKCFSTRFWDAELILAAHSGDKRSLFLWLFSCNTLLKDPLQLTTWFENLTADNTWCCRRRLESVWPVWCLLVRTWELLSHYAHVSAAILNVVYTARPKSSKLSMKQSSFTAGTWRQNGSHKAWLHRRRVWEAKRCVTHWGKTIEVTHCIWLCYDHRLSTIHWNVHFCIILFRVSLEHSFALLVMQQFRRLKIYI